MHYGDRCSAQIGCFCGRPTPAAAHHRSMVIRAADPHRKESSTAVGLCTLHSQHCGCTIRKSRTISAAMLKISPPTLSDADALLAFEVENRAYFEQWINARANDYYSASAVRKAIGAATSDRDGDRAYQYLVWLDDTIVGRINLVSITRPYFNKATLGYRIGEHFAGRGYASQAVKLAMDIAARELNLSRVEAIVRPQNVGSMRVLERNGFVAFGRASRAMHLHGEWHDLVYFECHFDEPGAAPATGPGKAVGAPNSI